MLQTMFDALQFGFVHRAMLAASVMAIVAGLLSCWLTLIGWSLLGDAVSHAVLPGVVIAYILGIPFAIGALVAAILAVGLVGTVKERTTLREDTSIGIVFTTFFAAGLVLVSKTPSGTNLQEILFGNLLGISQSSLIQVLVFGAVALAVIAVGRRAFTLWAFDPIHARTIGFNVTAIRWALLLCLAIVVVASVQAVGVILVVAMLITPGATAYLLTKSFTRMLVLAPALAWVCSMLGIFISFAVDVSTGGTIVLVQSLAFVAVYLFAPREGLLRRFLIRRRDAVDASDIAGEKAPIGG